MIKLKSNEQFRKISSWLRKTGRIFRLRRLARIEPSNNFRYKYQTYSALQVPASDAKEVEIMFLRVAHERDLPCRRIRGQVIEIDREKTVQ